MNENTQLMLVETEKKTTVRFKSKVNNRRSKKAYRLSASIRRAIETIYELIVNQEIWRDESKLCFSWSDLFEFAKIHFNIVSEELGISNRQILILCCLISKHDDIFVTENDIAGALECNLIGLMEFHEEIESLKKLRFIDVKKADETSGYHYRIAHDLIDALRKGEIFSPRMMKYRNLEDVLPAANDIFRQREDGWLDYDDFIFDLRQLVKSNKHLRFSNEIIKMKLSDEDLWIVFSFCIEYFNRKKLNIPLIDLYDYVRLFPAFKYTEALFDNGEHELIKRMIIERVSEHEDFEYFNDDEYLYRLTANTFDDLLSELPLTDKPSVYNRSDNIKTSNKPPEKKLFYNEAEEESIRKLEFIMNENNFQAVIQRLKDRNMPGGVTCFFYGSPGTGKTETALQLALKTGREIMQVDLSMVKDKFVGESEKNVKAIFDRYRALCKKSAIAPILLINEADGIFTSRVTINNESRNPTIAQMQNTMQNIMLNELDVFEGILIATTNLSNNMDSAFERRFLYKIEFKKPEAKVRKEIWHSLLPELLEEKIWALAKEYNFSGGEIQNIARKCNIDYVFSGITEDYDAIKKLCDSEQRGFYSKKEIIGFKAA